MKYLVVSAVSAVVVLFAFQNCNPKPLTEDNDALVSAGYSINKYNLGDKNLKSVNFYVQDVQSINKEGNSFSLRYNKTLKLDLVSGVLEESSDVSNEISTYCLPNELKAELEDILKNSQVCQSQPPVAPDQVCTQIFQTPYCEIFTDENVVGLGSASDGCGRNSIDLCEAQSEILKAYISRLSANYSQYICNN
jgi:hypothetical protein